MKKKIMTGIVAMTLLAGAGVYASSTTANSTPVKQKTNCPNKPGCICQGDCTPDNCTTANCCKK
jgi:hypothetical protein